MNYLVRLTQLETCQSPTDKTDKSTSVGFVSPLPVRIETERAAGKATAEPLLPDPAAEARRQRVLAMLADRQSVRYAVLTDTRADPEAVLLTLAIRGVGTCELRIPREKHDPFRLLDLIDRHGATVH